MRQNLIAVVMSELAISATPLTSAGLSESLGSAAIRSHSRRSADCACTAGGSQAMRSASSATPEASETATDRAIIPRLRARQFQRGKDLKAAARRQQCQYPTGLLRVPPDLSDQPDAGMMAPPTDPRGHDAVER